MNEDHDQNQIQKRNEQMKKILLMLVLLLVTLVTIHSAFADMAPDWRGDEQTLYAEWDEFASQWGPDAFTSNPGSLAEPMSSAVYGGSISDGVVTLNTDSVFEILLDNYENENPIKYGRLQVTIWDDDDIDGTVWDRLNLEILDIGSAVASISKTAAIQGEENWVTLVYDFTIEPNPSRETLHIVSGVDGLQIDSIVVDTLCTVPVPGSIWLMGTTLLGLLGFSRKS